MNDQTNRTVHPAQDAAIRTNRRQVVKGALAAGIGGPVLSALTTELSMGRPSLPARCVWTDATPIPHERVGNKHRDS